MLRYYLLITVICKIYFAENKKIKQKYAKKNKKNYTKNIKKKNI